MVPIALVNLADVTATIMPVPRSALYKMLQLAVTEVQRGVHTRGGPRDRLGGGGPCWCVPLTPSHIHPVN